MRIPSCSSAGDPLCTLSRRAADPWQATNAAVLNLALSTLPARQRRALAAAVPALDALALAVDRLADTHGT